MESGITGKCRLLNISPELRNAIYEEVFAFPSMADFLDSEPPFNALTRTCHQVRGECWKMYKEMYRDYWSTTLFTIDVFWRRVRTQDRIDNAIQDHPRGWNDITQEIIDHDKRVKVYAKVQQLRDEDVTHISNVCVYGEEAGECISLGKNGKDIWSHQSGSRYADHKSLEMYVPNEKQDAVSAISFELEETWFSTAYFFVDVNGSTPAEIEHLRRVVARPGLSKEELMIPIREVCYDCVRLREVEDDGEGDP